MTHKCTALSASAKAPLKKSKPNVTIELQQGGRKGGKGGKAGGSMKAKGLKTR